MKHYNTILINGDWVHPATNLSPLPVVNPATQELIAYAPACTEEDVDKAVQAAAQALDGWAALSPGDRSAYIQKIAEGLEQRLDEIALTITSEMGMPLGLSKMIQTAMPINSWKTYARLAKEYDFQEKVGHSLVVKEPIGVVACITPWNYPLHQVSNKVAAALAAGCTVVLKPSENTPGSAFILAEVIEQSGLPKGVFNLVTGTGPTVGEALSAHPLINMVSFTGSTRAGKRVAALAAENLKKVSLELGGKSASVILDDADLEAAAKGAVGACLLNSGQTCSAHTRLLVSETQYDALKPLLQKYAAFYTVGDPLQDSTRLGPIANGQQYQRVKEYITHGLESKAELIYGGLDASNAPDKGFYVNPTIFGRVDENDRLAQEEVFGPVLSVITYTNEDEAIRIANNSQYGLGGGVWSGDLERAKRVAAQIKTGQIDINGAPFNPMAPFGGYKKSGIGRENGVYGLEEFFILKSIQLPS